MVPGAGKARGARCRADPTSDGSNPAAAIEQIWFSGCGDRGRPNGKGAVRTNRSRTRMNAKPTYSGA
jgi:hypothetical protein